MNDMRKDIHNEEAVQKDFLNNFIPKVHSLGRFTMAVALILSIIPSVYMIFIKGYAMPVSTYITVAVTIVTMMLGGWLSQPPAVYPALGSAGTYIGYLAGGLFEVRMPVALSLQRSMDADIDTPRGQIVTIIGVVSSVIANLVILLITVLLGQMIIPFFPDFVKSAFDFSSVTLMAILFSMTFTKDKRGVPKAMLANLQYMVLPVIVFYVVKGSPIAGFGTVFSVAACALLSYILYRIKVSKAAS